MYLTPFNTTGVPAMRAPGAALVRGAWYIHARLSDFTFLSLILVRVLKRRPE